MQSLREILQNIFKTPTPEDPVDIHLQNEQMRQILADLLTENDKPILD